MCSTRRCQRTNNAPNTDGRKSAQYPCPHSFSLINSLSDYGYLASVRFYTFSVQIYSSTISIIAIFLSSNILGSIFQIASLPVVILAPLGAVSLLWNAFFARILLGDGLSLWMVLGTILIAGGAILIGIFGVVPEPTHSLEDLLALFRRPTFVVYFSLLGFVVVVCLIAVCNLSLSSQKCYNIAVNV
jgi:hypothetical protein